MPITREETKTMRIGVETDGGQRAIRLKGNALRLWKLSPIWGVKLEGQQGQMGGKHTTEEGSHSDQMWRRRVFRSRV